MRVGIALLVAAVLGAAPANAAVLYSIKDLGTLGGSTSLAGGINASGWVAGASSLAGDTTQHAFLYDGSKMKDLGTLGGSNSEAYGINASGQVTGWSELPGDQVRHAFLYDGAKMIDLGAVGGINSEGRGINASGQVAGYSYTELPGGPEYRPFYWGSDPHAFLYDGKTMVDLRTIGGAGDYSVGMGINDSGHVTGWSYSVGDPEQYAFVYDGTKMVDLLPNSYNVGYGINNLGQVTGWGYPNSFLFDGTKIIAIGALYWDGANSEGHGINNLGQVVGFGYDCAETYTYCVGEDAFLYDGSSMFDLNSLIDPRSNWSITDATGINDAGQIAGWSGDLYSGVGHALLLTPLSTSAVPEPAAWAMMIAGFGMIGGLARRKPISGAPSNT